MKNFIDKNREFWSSLPPKVDGKKILVEEATVPMIIHVLGVFSIILNQAKSFSPLWLYNQHTEIELLKSYVPTAEFVKHPKMSWLEKIKIIFSAISKFLCVCKCKNILSFSYDKVKYGDIVYDTYLAQKHVGTIKKIDLKILLIIYRCIKRHESILKVLKDNNIEAVLVSHRIGINSGVMLRVALRYGYKGYSTAGLHRATLMYSEGRNQAIAYEYRPLLQDIDFLTALPNDKFEKFYNFVLNEHISGILSLDAQYAFSKDNKFYGDRESFARDYGLNLNKKNVFVMLHAFTDHPHSHFNWMIFKDYHDWFKETLGFAKKNDKVNWIFKQHPSIRFYPTRDISFESLFSSSPKNVIYISEKDNIDTRSLIYLADLIVTCVGSAGFELPAMGGIPSVSAGDNHYLGLGFALEPKTKQEYFKILDNSYKIERLTSEQQKRAKAAYIYIRYLSKVDMSSIPVLSHEDLHRNQSIWYWEKVSELYEMKREIILDEIQKYAKEVNKPNYKLLKSSLDFLDNVKD